MGKNLSQQKRGKGSPTYKAPSFRYLGTAKHRAKETMPLVNGIILDINHSPGHSAPLVTIKYEDNTTSLEIAARGIYTGQKVSAGEKAKALPGNLLPLGKMPEGTEVFNIESQPGDGGKFVRSSGTAARIIGRTHGKVVVLLPSKKQRYFDPNCRACVGEIAGSGRKEKPMLKAGKKYHRMRAKNKLYPKVSAASMNAVDHPFGGSRSSKKGRPTIARRFAPPGAKVGMLRPKRSGKKKGG